MKTVIVYKKSKGSKQHYMLVLEDNQIDVVNNARARKPVIPDEYEIIDMGLGESMIDLWLEKYKIKKWSNKVEQIKKQKPTSNVF